MPCPSRGFYFKCSMESHCLESWNHSFWFMSGNSYAYCAWFASSTFFPAKSDQQGVQMRRWNNKHFYEFTRLKYLENMIYCPNTQTSSWHFHSVVETFQNANSQPHNPVNISKLRKYSLRAPRLSSIISLRSSAELARLLSPGVPGAEPPLTTIPDDELNTESPELPTHGTDGTRRYLQFR